MYTSGTTGNPKGVILKHSNMIAALAAAESRMGNIAEKGTGYLSYLPLAHIFERVVVCACFYRGSKIGFFQGDVRKLVEDIQTLQPSFIVGVPRVFDRIYDKIKLNIEQSSPLKQKIFNYAYEAKKKAIKEGRETPLLDLLVFNTLKQRIGGQVRGILSGSAPLTSAVHEFLLVCFGCPVIQGYGLTETCAGGTLQLLDDTNTGHTGPVIPCCEMKLEDVPEMNYFSSSNPPRGEVLIRGPHVTDGYYKDEEKTKQDFHHGWFHSGDIGQWNTDGTLSIIDRKKNIFKLSQGEYIAAEKIEGVLAQSKYVQQIWIYGDSTKPTLIAIVVPDNDNLLMWAKEHNINSSRTELCNNKAVNEMIYKDITNIGKAAKLRGFEFVKAIYLQDQEFSIDNGLLTPTFKLKRPQLKTFFLSQIDRLYAENPTPIN
jgi:long-chain acyl-CoA synthetase